MSELLARLRADQITARKSADKDRTVLLGTVLAALKNLELSAGREPDDAAIVDLLRRQVAQRLDSAEQFRQGQREDLATREDFEVAVLRGYLPADIDPDEIRAAARAAVAAGTTDMRGLMALLMEQFRSRTDGKVINQIAREALQGR